MLDQAASPTPASKPAEARSAPATQPPSPPVAGRATGADLQQPMAADGLSVTLARAVARRPAPVPLAQTLIQRAIDPATFARLDHSLARAAGRPVAVAVLTRDADGADCRVRHVAPPGAGFQLFVNTAAPGLAPVWGAPAAILPAALTANYTWTDEQINYTAGGQQSKTKGADALNQVGPGGAALTIREFAGDELALVHHTTGGGSPPHLTVENAHIGALHHIEGLQTIAGFDKAGKTKPDHENFMAGYGSAKTDNLNFFAGVPATISLATYLRVIRHAMDQIAGVPTVYGEEVIRSANAMAAAQHMNPANLYLPTGAGAERHLFRAALNMNKMNLIAVPPAIVAAFTGFDVQPKPQLTSPTGQVVTEGEGPYNALERDLIQAHLPALLVYLNTF